MNIKDWQSANEEHKRTARKDLPHETTQGPRAVQARIDVLAAELAAIAPQPATEENAAEKSSSCESHHADQAAKTDAGAKLTVDKK